MVRKTCQIVLVGHDVQKLFFSIDKEIYDKLIFITEKEKLPGSEKALETLKDLIGEYERRKVKVENKKFNFLEDTKPIAELTHLIYQQKKLGFENIIVNISGGLRYIDIWLYLACSITNTKLIHGDFVYEGDKEVGIRKNDELRTLYLGELTSKQFEFLELFYNPYSDYSEFFDEKFSFDENPLLNNRIVYDSIEETRIALNKLRGKASENITRGAINGFIRKLDRISALQIIPENQNKKKIAISYIGIAYFLQKLFEDNFKN